MTKQTRFNVGYAIAAIFLVFMIQYAVSVTNQIAPIPYSDFQRLLHEGKIATVGVSDRFIQGSLKEPLPGAPGLAATPSSHLEGLAATCSRA